MHIVEPLIGQQILEDSAMHLAVCTSGFSSTTRKS
jgi:hypothetical protein